MNINLNTNSENMVLSTCRDDIMLEKVKRNLTFNQYKREVNTVYSIQGPLNREWVIGFNKLSQLSTIEDIRSISKIIEVSDVSQKNPYQIRVIIRSCNKLMIIFPDNASTF